MEIKRFFWLLLSLSVFLVTLTACENFPIRTRGQGPATPGTQEPTPDEKPPEVIEKPEFLQKEAPRLGLILGGGGALSYAHIGVLQELEDQKIPVEFVGGTEWGAIVAGAYAQNNKAHAIEWKLLKLPIDRFNQKGGFFSSGRTSAEINELDGFLASVFQNGQFADSRIPYACPFLNIADETQSLYIKGLFKNAMKVCWPYPPHFKTATATAHPTGVEAVAKYLRNRGAEKILYIDVLSKNELLSKKDRTSSPQASLMWTQAKSVEDIDRSVVDEIIEISLPGYHINSYSSLRALVRMGQVKSRNQVKEFAKKYAY